jgi:hypothetical protein
MTHIRRFLLPIAALLLLTVSACSSPAAATPEPTADPTADPTAASTSAPTADPTDAETQAPASAPAIDPWRVNASEHRAAVGEEFTYDCPPADEESIDRLWGTEVYTDDSSICTAAVHAGAITLDEGGEVTIEITAGEDSYEGTEQNGVESLDYGPWGGSFIIVSD